ncbi:Peptidase E [Polaribacter huanghezhanensis]|uniref:dipeptidase PepE n=1 Tax=Polaribacter huanghezhanensis TaxID=1354726 RepID=UPI002647C0CF|nr:dipeptidase PepE [Polaribacter huanghezhanensis]WKD86397.1 Peptidase E [Polaribacter huanghezhanensis]
MKKLIIASTSTIHGNGYLEYLLPILSAHFKNVKTLLFIPYARPSGISYDDYTAKAKAAFSTIYIDVKGIHEFKNPKEAILNAEAIFIGGGNTFELVHQLYKQVIFDLLKEVVENGTPYLGTSAGSNICGVNMMNTNDMPIVYPSSFKTLEFIPFNINAHYLDPVEGSTHMGETRATRIKEFHVYNDISVVGLREGSWLEVLGNSVTLKGNLSARIFKKNEIPFELESGSEVIF